LIHAYWKLKLKPSETRLGLAPLVLPELVLPELVLPELVLPELVLPELLPLSELELLVVLLSSSRPHAAIISKKMSIKIGNVNFCNFIIGLPPPGFSSPLWRCRRQNAPYCLSTNKGETGYKLSQFVMSTFIGQLKANTGSF
jgi:hypothetical protein